MKTFEGYVKRWISETEYIIQQCYKLADNIFEYSQAMSLTKPHFLEWLNAGNVLTEIQYIPPSLSVLKSQLIKQLSDDSFQAKEAIVPQYREINAIRHKLTKNKELYSEYTVNQIDDLAKACRDEYYRVKLLIEAATTNAEAKTAYNLRSFPTTI